MLASVTLNIHPLIVYGAGIIPIVFILYFVIRPAVKRAKHRRGELAWLGNIKEQIKKEEQGNKLKELLPPPWLLIYDVIAQYTDHRDKMRKLYDELWLDPCLISKAACQLLAKKAAGSSTDEDYELAMKWLSKFQKPEKVDGASGEE